MVQCVYADATVTNQTQRTVLLALAWKHSFDKGCFPSIEVLQKLTMLGRATIFRALSGLEETHTIVITHGGKGKGKRNYYTFRYTARRKNRKIIHSSFADTGQDEEPALIDATANNESVQKNPKVKAPAQPLNLDSVRFPEGFDTPEMRDAILGWVEAREKKHGAPTNRGVELALKKVASFGHAIALQQFHESTIAGYAGVFPPKNTQKPKTEPEKLYRTVQ
jgi:hypothetical protein